MPMKSDDAGIIMRTIRKNVKRERTGDTKMTADTIKKMRSESSLAETAG